MPVVSLEAPQVLEQKPWSLHSGVFSLDRTVDMLSVSSVNTEMTGEGSSHEFRC